MGDSTINAGGALSNAALRPAYRNTSLLYGLVAYASHSAVVRIGKAVLSFWARSGLASIACIALLSRISGSSRITCSSGVTLVARFSGIARVPTVTSLSGVTSLAGVSGQAGIPGLTRLSRLPRCAGLSWRSSRSLNYLWCRSCLRRRCLASAAEQQCRHDTHTDKTM